jgi:phosphohistidine phosphatase SixA
MKFILFRHAHKGVLPFEDPELSLQGFEQAAKISNLMQNQQLPTPTRLLVSPKRRTSQTFYPTSKVLGLNLEVQKELDQHLSFESNPDFRLRISWFISQLAQSSADQDVIWVCTHYDWIEEAMAMMNSDKDLSSFEFSHWSPTQYVVFELAPHDKTLWVYQQKGTAK